MRIGRWCWTYRSWLNNYIALLKIKYPLRHHNHQGQLYFPVPTSSPPTWAHKVWYVYLYISCHWQVQHRTALRRLTRRRQFCSSLTINWDCCNWSRTTQQLSSVTMFLHTQNLGNCLIFLLSWPPQQRLVGVALASWQLWHVRTKRTSPQGTSWNVSRCTIDQEKRWSQCLG